MVYANILLILLFFLIMKICFVFLLSFVPLFLFTQQVDTIVVNKLPKRYSEELNYYNIYLKSGKTIKKYYFVGYDIEAISKIFNTNENAIQKIQFFANDSICYEQTNFKDTNFIWLVQKRKYEWHDTLRISESKKSGKIELEEVYTSYKYLNPIKISIKGEKLDIDLNNPSHSVMFWSGKRYIFTIPKVTRIIVYR